MLLFCDGPTVFGKEHGKTGLEGGKSLMGNKAIYRHTIAAVKFRPWVKVMDDLSTYDFPILQFTRAVKKTVELRKTNVCLFINSV